MSEQEQNSPAEEQARSEEATRMEDTEAEAIVGGNHGFEYANPNDPNKPGASAPAPTPTPAPDAPSADGILDGIGGG